MRDAQGSPQATKAIWPVPSAACLCSHEAVLAIGLAREIALIAQASEGNRGESKAARTPLIFSHAMKTNGMIVKWQVQCLDYAKCSEKLMKEKCCFGLPLGFYVVVLSSDSCMSMRAVEPLAQ